MSLGHESPAHAPRFLALQRRANSAHEAADAQTLARCADEIMALDETHGNRELRAWSHFFRGLAAYHDRDGGAATASLERALAFFRETNDGVNAARASASLAAVAAQGNAAPARARCSSREAEGYGAGLPA